MDTANSVQVYHTDGLGSMRALSDGTGNVVQTAQSDAFGTAIAAGTLGSAGQPFGFAGEPADALGLVSLRARSYVPSLGRFMSRDPLPGMVVNPGGLNRYSYAQNDPTRYADPSGRIIWIPAIIGIGALAGGGVNTAIYYRDNEGTANLSLGGAAGAFGKGALIGAVGTTVALLGPLAVAAADVGVPTLAGAALGNAAGGFASKVKPRWDLHAPNWEACGSHRGLSLVPPTTY